MNAPCSEQILISSVLGGPTLVGKALSFTHKLFSLFFTALHGMQTRYSDENSVRLSVRLSVCPSVTRVHCDKTEEKSVHISTPYER